MILKVFYAENHLYFFSCHVTCCDFTFRLEDDSEENIVPIGRAQRRTKLLATPSNIYIRRPGEPAVRVPVYHSAAIRTAKDTETGEDDLQLLGQLDAKKPESSSPGRSCYTARVSGSKVVVVVKIFFIVYSV